MKTTLNNTKGRKERKAKIGVGDVGKSGQLEGGAKLRERRMRLGKGIHFPRDFAAPLGDVAWGGVLQKEKVALKARKIWRNKVPKPVSKLESKVIKCKLKNGAESTAAKARTGTPTGGTTEGLKRGGEGKG